MLGLIMTNQNSHIASKSINKTTLKGKTKIVYPEH